jgi:hypothetical protein
MAKKAGAAGPDTLNLWSSQMDDGGPWYECKCGQQWQAPGHPKQRECPECETEKDVKQKDARVSRLKRKNPGG